MTKEKGVTTTQKIIRLSCVLCGKSFKPKRSTQRFCSSCRYDKHYYKKKATKELTCEQCGKTFESSQPKAKFCSDSCRAQHHKKTILTAANCALCGRKFVRSTIKQTYCCKEHYLEAKRERSKKEANLV